MSVMTRSQTAKKVLIESTEQTMKDLLAANNCGLAGHGQGLVMLSFKHSAYGRETKDMITFKLIDGKFKIEYCNFHPYGYPKYFKKIHGNNIELINAVEAYLRSRGENFVSYTLSEYDRMRAKTQATKKKQVSKEM
jgi:hypothetical protein